MMFAGGKGLRVDYWGWRSERRGKTVVPIIEPVTSTLVKLNTSGLV